MDYPVEDLRGRDVIVVHTIGTATNLPVVGHAVFCAALIREPEPATLRSIILTGRHDHVVEEMLVRVATGGELAPNSQRSWDVLTPGGARLQVKARVVTDPKAHGERQLSVFRSWDFDAVVIVLFDNSFGVWRATRISVDTLREKARFTEHVRGYRIIARDELLDAGEDWTELLRSATL